MNAMNDKTCFFVLHIGKGNVIIQYVKRKFQKRKTSKFRTTALRSGPFLRSNERKEKV